MTFFQLGNVKCAGMGLDWLVLKESEKAGAGGDELDIGEAIHEERLCA